MVGPPELRYATNGPWRLAYQVLGDGPDLMYLPGWVSNVEGNWLAPDHARFMERLASFARTIVVDRRGNGCSDRLSPGETSTLEEGVEDLRLIARAAQSFRTALFGVQEGGFYALLAAATHPERFTKLILFGAAHTWQRTDETPWGWSDDQWEDTEAAVGGPGPSGVAEGYIRTALPSYAGDPVAVRMMVTLLALSEGPSSAITEISDAPAPQSPRSAADDRRPDARPPSHGGPRRADGERPVPRRAHPGRHAHRATRAGRAAVGGGVRSGDRGDQPLPGRRGCAGGGPALDPLPRHAAVHGHRRLDGAGGEARRRRVPTDLGAPPPGDPRGAASARWHRGRHRRRRVLRDVRGPARAIECALAICEPSARSASRCVPASIPARSRRSTARSAASASTSDPG